MCGLYGSIGLPPDPARIDVVAHRGPDGRGWQVFDSASGPVALGHRRLAIIDLSDAGLQPMADPTTRYHLVFNGEIYNYVEIRDELKAKGEIFTTESDSEVLLRAYAVWGKGALGRLRGMFAFIIWDERDKQLFAARDRFGIKPLYIAEAEHGVALASEIKQLLGLPGVSARMNLERVHDFLSAGVSDHTSETMFAGVHQLRGGECVVIDASRARPVLRTERWYAIEQGRVHLAQGEAVDKFRDLLKDAVRLHLRSDVPVGSCLSGGLDSSSIVCLMEELLGSRKGGAQVKTVSACYPEKSVDEKPFMIAVVEHARTDPYYVYPSADDVFEKASQITWHQDEPFGSTSIFAQWCVFEEARRGAAVKVMLDGQGADEQLAGYHFAFPFYLAYLVRTGRVAELVRTMSERQRFHGVSYLMQGKQLVANLLPARLQAVARRRRREFADYAWLSDELQGSAGHQPDALNAATAALGLPEPTDLASLCLVMTHASNLQMLLHWEDRNSMAHSIEARVPFLDHPLVEFSLALGNDHKMCGGETKQILRQAMAGILPEMVRQRRDKLGFATPEQVWFRGPLRGPLSSAIDATLRRYPDLFNVDGTRRLAADMLEGRRPVDFTLWRIANLGIWGERFGILL